MAGSDRPNLRTGQRCQSGLAMLMSVKETTLAHLVNRGHLLWIPTVAHGYTLQGEMKMRPSDFGMSQELTIDVALVTTEETEFAFTCERTEGSKSSRKGR
jgi:hypothetical protein